MAKYVVKFGGAALEDLAAIEHAARLIQKLAHQGDQLVVVVSAMLGETNRLEKLIDQLSGSALESDIALSSGETAATALMAAALRNCKVDAFPLQGWQVPIITSAQHGQAKIETINPKILNSLVDQGVIPVVAGFQGVTEEGFITTFGRGGSDLTAVAIAVAIDADAVHFYKDVPGICSADPRIVDKTHYLKSLPLDDLFEQSSQGAKVLHPRALDVARAKGIKLEVKSFKSPKDLQKGDAGTSIEPNYNPLEHPLISGVVLSDKEVMLEVILKRPGLESFSAFLSALSQKGISVDLLMSQSTPSLSHLNPGEFLNPKDHHDAQSTSPSRLSIGQSYVLTIEQQPPAKLKRLHAELEALDFIERILIKDKVAKLSLVGSGLKQHPEVFAKVFKKTADLGINLFAISSSEIKITLLLSQSYAKRLAQEFHELFLQST